MALGLLQLANSFVLHSTPLRAQWRQCSVAGLVLISATAVGWMLDVTMNDNFGTYQICL